LSDLPVDCLPEQALEVCRNHEGKHLNVFFILASDLIESEEAAAFALEKKDRVDHADSGNHEGTFREPWKPILGNSVNRGHEIHRKYRRSIQGEDAKLPIGRGGSFQEFSYPGFRADIFERGIVSWTPESGPGAKR
jgi:hypothetical protein